MIVCVLIGFSPLIAHAISPEIEINIGQTFRMFEYRESILNPGEIIGPFGLGSAILSLFVVVGVGVGFGLYYKLRAQNVLPSFGTVEVIPSTQFLSDEIRYCKLALKSLKDSSTLQFGFFDFDIREFEL